MAAPTLETSGTMAQPAAQTRLRVRDLTRLWCVAPFVLAGCAGESVRHVPACQAAWQELIVPGELRPFYPAGGAWQLGHLAVLSFSAESPHESKERGIVYDVRKGFSAMSEAGMPDIGSLGGAVGWRREIAFISKYVSRQYLDNTSTQSRSLDGYFVNDVRLNYNFSFKGVKNIGIGLLINNVFSEKYQSDGATYPDIEGGKVVDYNYWFPQAPINFLASLNIKF